MGQADFVRTVPTSKSTIETFAKDKAQNAMGMYKDQMDACGYLARFFDVQMQLNHPTAASAPQ